MQIFFCDPNNPWQRGKYENTKMLIRDFFPQKTDFSTFTRKEIKYAKKLLNENPRKRLGFSNTQGKIPRTIVALKT